MSFFSLFLSVIHGLFLLLVPIFTFLWIIGKLKAIRERNETYSYQYQQSFPPTQPSPSSIPLQPRRLSFSSAFTNNTPTTPNATPKRRVTFSLTPEQQRNELLKTAVRRREALPSANLLIQNHSSPQHYQPQPREHVAHLFPSPNYASAHEQPSSPPTLPSVNHPIPVEKPLQKTVAPPNYDYDPLRKRYRSPRKPLPRPTSPPSYVANLAPSSRTANPQSFNLRHQNHPGSNPSAQRSDIRLFNPNLPTHTGYGIQSANDRPPKASGFNNIQNGFVQRSVR